jgi:hypothetical protein
MEFDKIIAAMDRLNSWVRSESYRVYAFGGPRRAIYHYKSAMIRYGIDSIGGASVRRIVSSVKCRDCGGTGRYTSQYGREFPTCRACRSTGTASLEFIETKFAVGVCWHTPMSSWPFCSVNAYSLAAEVDSFRPCQVGKDMAVGEVAADLHAVESFLRKIGVLSRLGQSYAEDLNYRLHLGKTKRVCGHCGSAAFLPEFGTCVVSSFNFVQWQAYAHDACYRIKAFDFPFRPPAVIADPRVQKWLAGRNLFSTDDTRYHAHREVDASIPF